MAGQLCCRVMCKNLLRSDGQQRNCGKAKFLSNLNSGQKIVSETGPRNTCKHLGMLRSHLETWFFTRGLRVLSSPASVCVCVCVCLSVCQSRVCQRDNSSPVQARITKFGVQMQKTLVNVPIVLRGDRPWPSRSNLTWKSNFTSFWACPYHNWSLVQARITKFGPDMHLSEVKIPIDLGVDRTWSSRSNFT